MTRASPSLWDRLRLIVTPKISRAEAIELAREEGKRRNAELVEPVHVHWGLFSYTIRDRADWRGCNCVIVIDKWDGRVLRYSVAPV